MIQTWKQLELENQIDAINETSKTKTVAIFKHSTRCGISLHALDKLASSWDISDKELDFYYLDLLNFRNISNEVAKKYGVIHQSPQLIIIRNGKAVYDISHSAISLELLKKKL
jgi:bacillithiol system protein YtxJ